MKWGPNRNLQKQEDVLYNMSLKEPKLLCKINEWYLLYYAWLHQAAMQAAMGNITLKDYSRH